jgi:hypothetical protein
MGAWGPAIFSDDIACDVRLFYRDLVADGKTGSEATDLLLEGLSEAMADPDDGTAIWLALAAVQWKCGRLEKRVKDKALEIIDNGVGLALWEEQGHRLLQKRKDALAKLREQIVSPQPPVKPIRKRFVDATPLRLGDAITYRLVSGSHILLKVVGHMESMEGISPVFALLSWQGDKPPSPARVASMKPMKAQKKWMAGKPVCLASLKASEYPLDRIEMAAHTLPVGEPVQGGFVLELWRFFDEWLTENYGLS